MSEVVILDYGAGNLRSVSRAVAHAGVEALVTREARALEAAKALILPGVGAAANTMANLRAAGLVDPIRDYIASGRPFLGVCMGLQALFEFSEEGGRHDCLGVLRGKIVRFSEGLTVPHMGWNTVQARRPHPVFEGIPGESYFYFVHSYHPLPEDEAVVIGETEYGVRFPAVVGRDNLIATQFHPEKSGEMGLRLYANFLRLARERGSIAPTEAASSEAAPAAGARRLSSAMEIIPAIDIREGRCVRLTEGDYAQETVFDDDPVKVAVRWASLGAHRIHVVDLDGAREGRQANAAIVRAIVQTVDSAVQTGGGIRDLETLRATLDSGANRVVLGTAAVKDPELLREAVALARKRLIVSVDARDGLVRLEGWTEGTELPAVAWIGQLATMGVERVVYTDIARDGRLAGPNFAVVERLIAETSVAVIAAGGVTTVQDVERLSACGAEAAIIGRALYTGDIDLAGAIAAAA